MRDGIPLPRAAWGSTLETFVGPHRVSETFAIDGREEEYALYFDAPYDLSPAWTSADGLHAVHLVTDEDWDPPTAVLIDARTQDCAGFYAGGELWIDPEHRGRGLSTALILCLVDHLGRAAYDNRTGMGFSAAGYAAHAAAHRNAVTWALDAGIRVPKRVAAAVEVRDASAPAPAA